jgi:hypothetical protein
MADFLSIQLAHVSCGTPETVLAAVNLQFRELAGEVLPLRAEAGSSRIGREPGALAIVSGPRFVGLSR